MDKRDRMIGGAIVKKSVLKGIDLCHKASTEIIINIAAIRINGAKIVL
jgi:hypothetical protein